MKRCSTEKKKEETKKARQSKAAKSPVAALAQATKRAVTPRKRKVSYFMPIQFTTFPCEHFFF